MKKEYYVFIGDGPEDWCNQQPLGPFKSEASARSGILADVEHGLLLSDSVGRIGVHENSAENYVLVQVIESFQPVIDIRAKVTLGLRDNRTVRHALHYTIKQERNKDNDPREQDDD